MRSGLTSGYWLERVTESLFWRIEMHMAFFFVQVGTNVLEYVGKCQTDGITMWLKSMHFDIIFIDLPEVTAPFETDEGIVECLEPVVPAPWILA